MSMIKSFCFNQTLASVLSFDKTYNLGSIFVTTSVFTNKALLRRSTDDEPIFIGPIFLHSESGFESFAYFMGHLSTKFVDCESQYLRIGSDDELALRKAILHAFPKSQRLLCTRHMKDNVIRYLQDKVGCESKTRNAIASEIFGTDGLTAAVDISDCDERAARLVGHLEAKTTDEFQTYVRNKVLVQLRENLHSGNLKWTSNNVESINHVFKQAVNWTPQMLPDLIDTLFKLVTCQIHDSQRAIMGRGDYQLRPSHARFRVSSDDWLNMSEAERTKAVRKCFVVNPKVKTVTSTNGKLTVLATATALGEKKNQRKRKRNAKTVTIPKCLIKVNH